MFPTADSNYSVWKASRKLTRPPQIIPLIRRPQGGWARSPIEKANLFAKYLYNVFNLHSPKIAAVFTEYLHSPFQMSPPIESFTSVEIIELIRRLNPRKSPGHDLICNKAIKELLMKGTHSSHQFLTQFFALNTIPRPGKYHWLVSSLNPENQYMKLASIVQLVFCLLCQNYSRKC